MTIQSGLAKDLSEPLDSLMNNAHMQESQARTAVLEDTDVETFVAFCEFAYAGDYSVPEKAVEEGIKEDEKAAEKKAANNVGSDEVQQVDLTLLAGPYEEDALVVQEYSPERFGVFSGFGSPVERSYARKAKKKAHEHHPVPVVEKDIIDLTDIWSKFKSLDYAGQVGTNTTGPSLLFHGKVYVFAQKYLVYQLKSRCLQRLHSDLFRYDLGSDNASQILDFLQFAYASTGRHESGGDEELRKLVIHFVACKVKLLGKNSSFLALLDDNGEIGSDLVRMILT